MDNAAEQAIARSISHNEIVTVDFDGDSEDTLNVESEDSVVGNSRTEYWGTDESGNEWRVHMRHRDEPESDGSTGDA